MDEYTLEQCPQDLQQAVRGFGMAAAQILHLQDQRFEYHCAYFPLELYGTEGKIGQACFCILQNICLHHGPMPVEVALLVEHKPPQQIAGIPLVCPDEAKPVFEHLIAAGDYQLSPLEAPKADFDYLRGIYGEECNSYNGQLWIPLKPELFGLSIEVWHNVVDNIDPEILNQVDRDVRTAMGFDESKKFKKRIESYDQLSWVIYTFTKESE